MGRPHIEFIQSQVLPFSAGLYGGSRPEVGMRILSIDAEQGDASTQLRYPPGWQRNEPEYLLEDEEFFVLEGSLQINGRLYTKHHYAHLPKGYLRNTQSSATGAVVLTFFSGEPKAVVADEAGTMFDPRRLVEQVDTLKAPAMTMVADEMDTPDWDPTGSFHKSLFEDPYTGERTWLIGMMPHWSTDLCETHPVVEEEFAVLGDLCFPMGVFRDGGYFWRPPGIEHGPFCTWGGALHLIRCKGGPFATEWTQSTGPVWDPEYDPILPEDYRQYAAKSAEYDREPGY